MGSFLSKTKREKNHGGGKQVEVRGPDPSGGVESISGGPDMVRLTELMQALQRIARLQRAATSARIEGRQKRREAANKRQDVWIRDANFMTEIQRLVAEGKLGGMEILLHLASQCQATRDGLGQVEQEAIDTEQQWEGQIWKLREAENKLYAEFENEFTIAESYPPGPPSLQSSKFGSSSNLESQQEAVMDQTVFEHRPAASVASSASITFNLAEARSSAHPFENASQDLMLLGLDTSNSFGEVDMSYTACSDSGIGDIDEPADHWSTNGNLGGPSQQLPLREYPAIELFPQLLVDFASRRDRINKWLEEIILDSHLESTYLFRILQARLASENEKMPSNWSQLAIAFWELDGAAVPRLSRRSDTFSTERFASGDNHQLQAISRGERRTPHGRSRLQAPVEVQSPASSTFDNSTTWNGDGHFESMIGRSHSMKSGPDISPPSPPRSHANSEIQTSHRDANRPFH
ncbi:hypothetical protein BKA65DRAFT_268543 [Rhexocercosporidium sp. MPI-PUGE-AT-0058]|nr:hypothetical protein BKA65DRAFT_268543 [Rhexocercosporidium sp. MPI-PUGE-AT-0058]